MEGIKMKTRLRSSIFIFFIFFFLASSAQATAILELKFDVFGFIIYDNSPEDTDPMIGAISVNGQFVNLNYDITGYSKPYSDSSSYPRMFDSMTLESDLFLMSGGGVKSILISFYDSGFGNRKNMYEILFNSTDTTSSFPRRINGDNISISAGQADLVPPNLLITTKTYFSVSETFEHGIFNHKDILFLCDEYSSFDDCIFHNTGFDNTKYYLISTDLPLASTKPQGVCLSWQLRLQVGKASRPDRSAG